MIYVTLQHPSPYYDDSYGVNSENNGPYGDAIMQELIPAIEIEVPRHPRAVGAHADGRIDRRLDRARAPGLLSRLLRRLVRALPGRASTSAITRSSTSTTDANAYWVDKGWMKVDRPDTRRPDGNITSMMKDENWFELVAGRPLALGRPVGHLGSDLLARSAPTAIRSASGTRRPASSTRTSPSTGRSTTTCATSSRPTGRRSGRSRATSSTSTSATRTRTT